jgi:hypothetical protein
MKLGARFLAVAAALAPLWPLAAQNAVVQELVVSDGFAMSVPHPEARRGGSAVVLKDGSILLAYNRPDPLRGVPLGTGRIYAVVSADGGKTWGQERLLEHNPACQTGRPSFLRTRDKAIWIFYYGFVNLGKSAAESRSDLWAIRSTDEGKTWGQRKRIFSGYTGATNGAIQTRSGRIVVPFSYMVDPMRFVSAVVVSDDDGRTWTSGATIDFGPAGGLGDHAGALEPAVVERRDGTLWMLIRTTRGRLWQAFSKDAGRTWSESTATAFAAPSSPAYITRLASGRLCIAWNIAQPSPEPRRGKLSVALSADDGETWTPPVLVARANEISYPYLLEVTPGELLISSGRLRAKGMTADVVALRAGEQRLLAK